MRIHSIKSENYFTLFMNALKGKTPQITLEDNFKVVRRHIPGKMLLEIWRRFRWPLIETLANSRNADIFHSPNFFYQATQCKRIVVTIHDLAFLKETNYGSRYSGKYHRETLLKRLSDITKIIVVSNTVKHDVLELCKVPEEKIEVIHHGLGILGIETVDEM